MSRRHRDRFDDNRMTRREMQLYEEYLERLAEEEAERQAAYEHTVQNLPRKEQEAAFLKLHSPNASGQTLAEQIKKVKEKKENVNNLTRLTEHISKREGRNYEEVNDYVHNEIRRRWADPNNTLLENLRIRSISGVGAEVGASGYTEGVGTGTRTRNVPVPNAAFPLRKGLTVMNMGDPSRRTHLPTTLYNDPQYRRNIGLNVNTDSPSIENIGLNVNTDSPSIENTSVAIPGSEWTTHEGGPAGGEGASYGGKSKRTRKGKTKKHRRRASRRSRR